MIFLFLLCSAWSASGQTKSKAVEKAAQDKTASAEKTSAQAKANPDKASAQAKTGIDKPVDKTADKSAQAKMSAADKAAAQTARKLDSLKNLLVKPDPVAVDTAEALPTKFKAYKKNAHASYYHNKFNGKRTSSGKRFDNNKYTAAHRKFPFGTKLRITNEKNGKSVIVEVIDRGPFSKGREIDLTRKAFMEIADNKGSGSMDVTIEEALE